MKKKSAISFHAKMMDYKKQAEKKTIPEAYKGIMEYIQSLRSYFKNKYPFYHVPSNIYYGYMDMTYFSIIPESLKHKKLKFALVFIHEHCRFEVWLCGSNKLVQLKYWKLLKEKKWNKYHLPESIKGIDSIIENILIEHPNFDDLDKLTKQIEKGTVKFIDDVQLFLSRL
jgi:hypothetical protein